MNIHRILYMVLFFTLAALPAYGEEEYRLANPKEPAPAEETPVRPVIILPNGHRVDPWETLPEGWIVRDDGSVLSDEGVVLRQDGTVEYPFGPYPEGYIVRDDGSIVRPDGFVIRPRKTQEALRAAEKKNGEAGVSEEKGKEKTPPLPRGAQVLQDGTIVLPDGSRITPDGKRLTAAEVKALEEKIRKEKGEAENAPEEKTAPVQAGQKTPEKVTVVEVPETETPLWSMLPLTTVRERPAVQERKKAPEEVRKEERKEPRKDVKKQEPGKEDVKKKEPPQKREKPKSEEKPGKTRAPRIGEKLSIPPDAARTGNLSFLEGCWQGTRPEYYSKRTIYECFCFGKNGGSGKRRVIDPQGGRRCVGATSARLSANGVLSVSSTGAVCSDGERWGQAEMTCRGKGQNTPCSWIFKDAQGGSQAYSIPFVRVQSCGRR